MSDVQGKEGHFRKGARLVGGPRAEGAGAADADGTDAKNSGVGVVGKSTTQTTTSTPDKSHSPTDDSGDIYYKAPQQMFTSHTINEVRTHGTH